MTDTVFKIPDYCISRNRPGSVSLSALNTLAPITCFTTHQGHFLSLTSLVMFFLILAYYLAGDASPISPINNRSLEQNSCNDLTHSRTIWNIVWSCLVTIFSCTWVAVHPNVPCPINREAKNSFQRWIRNPILSFTEHRLPLFVCALLIPEYILAWAIRQYLTARKIANQNKGELYTLCCISIPLTHS